MFRSVQKSSREPVPSGEFVTHCLVVTTSTPPSFAATAPDGTRIVVHPHASTDSVEELARALDLPAPTALAIDGIAVERHQRLADTDVRVGSAITVRANDGRSEEQVTGSPSVPSSEAGTVGAGTVGVGTVEVAIVSGPACASWRRLVVGRHTVGRAPSADVCIDDPAVELHHGMLDVGAGGEVGFTQLTGRVPITVGGVPCSGSHPVRPDEVIRCGASELLVRVVSDDTTDGLPDGSASVGSVVVSDVDPWRRVVRRAPPVAASGPVQPIEVPEPPGEHRAPPLTSLVGAGVAVAGAGLLAAVLGQAMFAMFAAIGALASFATWAVGAIVARRRQRSARGAHQCALEALRATLRSSQRDAARHHRTMHLGVVDVLDIASDGGGGRLWSRRVGVECPLRATVGRGTCHWSPPIDAERRRALDPDLLVTLGDCERLVDVPVPVAFPERSVLAIHGPTAAGAALCRSIVVQLGVTSGPSDWQILVVANRPEQWRWVGWLPQAVGGAAAVVDAGDVVALAAALDRSTAPATPAGPVLASAGARSAQRGRQLMLILDVPGLLTARTGPLRRRFDRGDVSCIVMVPPEVSVPAMATRVFDVGETGRGRWVDTADRSTWDVGATDIRVAGISLAVAEATARRLAPLIDPEDHDDAGGVPATVSLADLEPIGEGTSTMIARRWLGGGNDPAPVAKLGVSADGVVDIDLVRDGPHGLIAGTTGAGKSELLRTLVVTLAAQVSPDHLTMVLVDFKGGSTFDACARLPHTVGVVTDLDDGLAARVLVSLDAEVRRRERLLRAAGADDLAAYRRTSASPLPRLLVVIDEFASLAKELPDFLHALVDVAQRGRSLGVHLMLATQRPAGVVTDDIRANADLRIALRLQDRSDADDVVGDAAPAAFPVGVPGRAALRLGPGELVTFQAADSSSAVPAHSSRLSIEWCPDAVRERPERSDSESHRDRPVSAPAEPSALVRLTDAVCEAAVMVDVRPPHRPWIDALPSLVTPRHLAHELGAANQLAAIGTTCASIGLVDDPAHQCRTPLTWQPGDGNLLLVGAVGSGTTTAAAAIVAASLRGRRVR